MSREKLARENSQMNKLKSITSFVLELSCLLLLLSCSHEIRYQATCSIPSAVQEAQLFGVWQAEYRNFLADDPDHKATRISGVEKVTIRSDGFYVQTFDSPTYTYTGQPSPWRLIDEGDGPKLAMENWRHFANGIEVSHQNLLLRLQTPDEIRFREKYGYGEEARSVTLGVHYPQDGFVYLYPRNCLGVFALLQMVSSPADPDNPAVRNPVFEKVPGK
jgi:hypothetical protein